MWQLLLGAGYTSGVFAEDNVLNKAWQRDVLLVNELAVADIVYGNAGINISDSVKIERDVVVYLYDILLSKLFA